MAEHENARAALSRRARELTERLAQHESTLGRLRAQLGSEVTDDEHDPEGTTMSADWALWEGVRASEQHELDEVQAALERLDNGSYGRCSGCGRPIPPERLEVRPMATRCVACAS